MAARSVYQRLIFAAFPPENERQFVTNDINNFVLFFFIRAFEVDFLLTQIYNS